MAVEEKVEVGGSDGDVNRACKVTTTHVTFFLHICAARVPLRGQLSGLMVFHKFLCPPSLQ